MLNFLQNFLDKHQEEWISTFLIRQNGSYPHFPQFYPEQTLRPEKILACLKNLLASM